MNELLVWYKAHVRHPDYGERVLAVLDDGDFAFVSMERDEGDGSEPPTDVWVDDQGRQVRVKWWASVEGPV